MHYTQSVGRLGRGLASDRRLRLLDEPPRPCGAQPTPDGEEQVVPEPEFLLTALSCFSGAGGLDLGLEAAGFETIGCLELDGDAQETLRLNRPGWTLLEPADVVLAGKQLKPGDLGLSAGDLDLIAGGPPCQPFSKAAQWTARTDRGLADPRGQAVLGMLDLVESFLPQAILIENVSGFLFGAHSAADVIESRLKEIDRGAGTSYVLTSFVVDAADYGVPQHRLRALVTAFRDGHVLSNPPTRTHAGAHLRAGDALADVAVDNPPKPTGKWAELLACIPEGGNYQYLTARGDGPEVFGYRTRYWSFLAKLARDRPSWTLPASPGPSTGPFHWDNRPLAAVERLALQGFPTGWNLSGEQSALVRLAGNATPPPLAEAAARQLAGVLRPDAARSSAISTLAKQRVAALPPAKPPLPAIPSSLAHELGSKAAHPGVGAGPGRVKAAPS